MWQGEINSVFGCFSLSYSPVHTVSVPLIIPEAFVLILSVRNERIVLRVIRLGTMRHRDIWGTWDTCVFACRKQYSYGVNFQYHIPNHTYYIMYCTLLYPALALQYCQCIRVSHGECLHKIANQLTLYFFLTLSDVMDEQQQQQQRQQQQQ